MLSETFASSRNSQNGRVLRLRRNTHWHYYTNVDRLISLKVAQDILGQGGVFVASRLEDCLIGLTALPPKLEQVLPRYSSSVVCQFLQPTLT